MKTIFASIVVWDEEYTQTFLNYNLPILANVQLPILKRFVENITLYIHTSSHDYQSIVANPNFQAAEKKIPIQVICTDQVVTADEAALFLTNHNMCRRMQVAHKHFIFLAQRANAGMLFLAPDAWFSDQIFITIGNQIKSGKRAIMTLGPRVEKEPVLDHIKQNKNQFFQNGICSTDLVALLLKWPHHITQSLSVNIGEVNVNWPSVLYWWNHEAAGLMARGFHLHPLFVFPRKRVMDGMKSTIDGDLISNAGLNENDIYVISHSQEGCVIELTAQNRRFEGEHRTIVADDLVRFVKLGFANFWHQYFFDQPIFFCKEKNFHFEHWDAIIQSSKQLVQEYGALMHLKKRSFFRLPGNVSLKMINWAKERLQNI